MNDAEVAPAGTRTSTVVSRTSSYSSGSCSVVIPLTRTRMSVSTPSDGAGAGRENCSMNSASSPSATLVSSARSLTVERRSSRIPIATQDGLPARTWGGRLSVSSDTVNRSWCPSASSTVPMLTRPAV